MRPWLLTIVLLTACSSGTASDDAPSADDAGSQVTAPATDVRPATTTATTTTTSATTAATGRDTTSPGGVITPEGFESVAATITTEAGEVCEVCLWLADTSDLRARGLMFVTDLGGADGMAFVYPTPHTGTFWMRNTVTPLSIAFFAPDGAYLDAFDMEPCSTAPCLQYATPRDFTVAIEVVQGDLGAIGIAPGSRLDLSDLPCDPDA